VNICDPAPTDGDWPRRIALCDLDRGSPGTYILIMHLASSQNVAVGSLGEAAYDGGWYLYVGSALRGLKARLARHARSEKRIHWHIDYLLEAASLVEVWCHIGNERLECEWAHVLGRVDSLEPSAVAFGASDCRCRTHLFRADERPDPHAFVAGLRLAGLDDRLWIVARDT